MIQKEHSIDHVVITLAGNGLVVNDQSPGRADQTQPAFAQAQTKIHVLISGEKMFVEAADFMEERLADQLLLAIEDDLLMDSASAQFGLQASGQLGDLIEVPSYSRRRDLAFLVDPQADEGESLRQSIAQGAEAGSHRGTFAGPFDSAIAPTLELVRSLRAAVSTPIIASGGLMAGRDIAQAPARGARAAQLGTAFLMCPEAGTSEAYRRAILAARTDTTVITRAFSGRPARGLLNTFITKLEGQEKIILPFPLQNALTRPIRTDAAKLPNVGI